MALLVVASGCSIEGGKDASDGPDRGDRSDRTTSTRPADHPSTTTRTPTTDANRDDPPAEQAPADVPDPTFPGLGDPRIDVEHYDVHISTSTRSSDITGRVTLRARSTQTSPLRSFTLDLAALTVDSVTVDGTKGKVQAKDDQIVITPKRPIASEAAFEATVRYHGTPESKELPALAGVAIGWQPDDTGGSFTMSEPYGTSTWMPVSDHPSDKASYRLTADVPEGITVVGNGVMAEPKTAKGRTRWVWTQAEPMASYLAMIAIGKYDLAPRKANGITVIDAFPAGNDKYGSKVFAVQDEILSYFGRTFGPYPFKASGVIVVPATIGVAMENQTRSLFSEATLAGVGARDLAHELSHQWFGDDVTIEDWSDIWLNEGFATYADYLWKAHDGQIDLDAAMSRLADRYAGDTDPVVDPAPDQEFDPEVYERGALTLHALRLTIGDEAFFRVLRAWVHDHAGANASTDDFIALADRVSGKDLASFFEAWLGPHPTPALPG